MTKAPGTRRDRGTQKVLVRIWKPLAQRLSELSVEACLRRDEYLDKVLLHEARALDAEMTEPNSEDGEAALERAFGCIPITPVNLRLSEETVKTMKDVCRGKRIPRNTFVNRVILLLIMRDEAVPNCLYFCSCPWLSQEIWHELLVEASKEHPDELQAARRGSTLRASAQLFSCDPFWSFRYRIAMLQRTDPNVPDLHCARILHDYFSRIERQSRWYIESAEGLNCYLPDEFVEGTIAHQSIPSLEDFGADL